MSSKAVSGNGYQQAAYLSQWRYDIHGTTNFIKSTLNQGGSGEMSNEDTQDLPSKCALALV